MDATLPLSRQVEALFDRHGHGLYDGQRRESVTALAHALQCAQLAEWAGASPPLVVAALLHDVGHFVHGIDDSDAHDDVHELRALPWLSRSLGPEVTEPIRLHVQAKRYLVVVDPAYGDTLSPASVHSLALQGGAMTPAECAAFEGNPYAADATLLRRWDDAAKSPGKATPSLAWYLSLIDELCAGPTAARTPISAFDAT